ncbi:MAG TPA: hypothetical protein VE861_05265, partial [Gemmatimonadaceae bacterium]|nr:hypothetical protein [Gemmatimonadaceae bacterium]
LIVTWQGEDDDRGYGRGRDGYDRRDNGNHSGWYKGDRKDDRRDDRRGGYDDRRGGYDDRDSRGGDLGGRRDAGVLRFSASVDDVAEIRIRGRRVEAYARSGRQLYDVRYDVRGASLPQYALPLDLRRMAGRGNVTIAQYPRAYNDWTAIIRIDDSRGGPDNYAFDLSW